MKRRKRHQNEEGSDFFCHLHTYKGLSTGLVWLKVVVPSVSLGTVDLLQIPNLFAQSALRERWWVQRVHAQRKRRRFFTTAKPNIIILGVVYRIARAVGL